MRAIVMSRSPLEFTWRNSEQVQGDLVDVADALKNDPAIRRIALSGSVSVVRQLLDAGLLDELHLFVTPIVVGGGNPWLPDGVRVELELLDEHRFGSGVVYLRYRTRT